MISFWLKTVIKMKELFNTGLYSDIIIKILNKDYLLHKKILSIYSGYFKGLIDFYTDKSLIVIEEIDDLDISMIPHILGHIYGIYIPLSILLPNYLSIRKVSDFLLIDDIFFNPYDQINMVGAAFSGRDCTYYKGDFISQYSTSYIPILCKEIIISTEDNHIQFSKQSGLPDIFLGYAFVPLSIHKVFDMAYQKFKLDI